MVTQFRIDIGSCIPSVRIESYRILGQTDSEMLTSYFWNVELAKALHPSLHALEISYRNMFHDAMTARHNAYWFDHLNTIGALGRRQIEQLRSVRQRLTHVGKAHSADNIVAELMLGFWADLASSFYERSVWRQNQFELIRLVFPSGPANLNFVTIGRRLSMANALRNRMFHHEPIYADQLLGNKHRDISELIQWLNPRLAGYVTSVDTFGHVFLNGRTTVEQSILAFV